MGKSVVETVNKRCGIDDNNEGGRDGLEAHKSMVSQKVEMLRVVVGDDTGVKGVGFINSGWKRNMWEGNIGIMMDAKCYPMDCIEWRMWHHRSNPKCG